jgi:glycosyltransferase involved in cell wall biosynthesis
MNSLSHRKKKILIACASFPPRGKGGGPQSSFLFAKGLIDLGFDVLVVTVGDDDQIENYEGIKVTVVKSPNIYWDYLNKTYSPLKKIIWHVLENFNPIAFFKIMPIIKNFKPDIVVTISIENINVTTWLAAKYFKIPIVHIVQSYFLFCYKGGFFKGSKNCEKQCFDCKVLSCGKKLLSNNVNAVIGETNFVMQEHVKQSFFKKIELVKIPTPILSFPQYIPKTNNGPLIVGYMGVIEQHKGVEVLAKAASIIGASGDVKFMIAGTSRNSDYLNDLKLKFGSADVTFMGWVKPEDAYPKFDVLVVPSLWKEPFGRIVVEALSYGVPVIAAKSGGLIENIEDGVNGYLYDAEDYNQLEEIIKKLSKDKDLLFKLSAKAKDSALSEFKYDTFIDRLQKFFSDFIESHTATK